MADALCGPSNALQSLKNHSQVDRTLQQDRLTGARQPPVQGFRTPDPRGVQALDAELAIFEQRPLQAFQRQQPQQLPSLPFPRFQPAQLVSQLRQQDAHSAPGWAADFQKLHLGPAQNQPMPRNQFRSEAPMVRANAGRAAGGWHDDFVRQQQQYSASNMIGKQQATWTPAQLAYMQAQSLAPGVVQQQLGVQQSTHYPAGEVVYQDAQVDMVQNAAAFEAAFAQAEAAPASRQTESQPQLSHTGEVAGVRLDPIFNTQTTNLTAKQPTALHSPEGNPFQPLPEHQPTTTTTTRIGSDAIHYPDPTTTLTPEKAWQSADELSRTAGQLLTSVSHETSSKFEQSQFLALMRRIRDREVVVEGEEFRDTTKTGAFDEAKMHSQQPGGDFEAATQQHHHHHQHYGMDGPNAYPSSLEAEGTGARQFVARPRPGTLDQPSRIPVPASERATADGPDNFSWQVSTQQEAVEQQAKREEDFVGDLEDMHALHPGGRGYPVPERRSGGGGGMNEDEDRHRYDHWASGGIGVEDERIVESQGVAGWGGGGFSRS